MKMWQLLLVVIVALGGLGYVASSSLSPAQPTAASAPIASPVDRPRAVAALKRAAAALESYRRGHGTYAGATVAGATLSAAGKAGYCLEASSGSTTVSRRGAHGPVADGGCTA